MDNKDKLFYNICILTNQDTEGHERLARFVEAIIEYNPTPYLLDVNKLRHGLRLTEEQESFDADTKDNLRRFYNEMTVIQEDAETYVQNENDLSPITLSDLANSVMNYMLVNGALTGYKEKDYILNEMHSMRDRMQVASEFLKGLIEQFEKDGLGDKIDENEFEKILPDLDQIDENRWSVYAGWSDDDSYTIIMPTLNDTALTVLEAISKEYQLNCHLTYGYNGKRGTYEISPGMPEPEIKMLRKEPTSSDVYHALDMTNSLELLPIFGVTFGADMDEILHSDFDEDEEE